MNDYRELGIGLGFLGLIIVSLCAYAAWNVLVRGKSIRKAAEEDAKSVKNGKMTRDELYQKIQSITKEQQPT